ncbi:MULTISPECIES: M56 family metallopeptidase [unclassified Chryseobacterium]|uniref:M56 family metallopeptidase n=1 Tax=unclassified Chryseobacterium TaxID=2593645 RepID=UPI002269DE44|nr:MULTISPECIES: M56 family metallopeptidase [unclassified Chryseobacterium]
MILIFIKIILCSSLLIALYYLLLEKEKMYRFNRFFLISSLIFSCLAPLISIKTENPKPISRSRIIVEDATQQILDLSQKEENFNWINLIVAIYGIVTLFLLTKAIYSIFRIKKIKGKKIVYQNHNVIVTENQLSPFTFWKTIYLGKNYLINNTIDSRVFLHEKSHLEQKHSFDLLFIEFLKILMWFNPALYFYKKAIITNHEFLADEAVLMNDFNVKEYQELILDEIISGQNYNLTHTFNFNNTKKRFIMMNRKKSKLTGFKKVISIPMLIVAFGLFVQRTYASDLQPSHESFTQKTKPEKTQQPTTFQQIVDDTKELLEQKKVTNTNDEKMIADTIRPKSKNSSQDTTLPKQEIATAETENITNPVYPGGMNQLRSKVANTFDSSKLGSSKATLRTDIEYVINEEGTVEHLMVTGDNETFNNEAKAAFIKANEGIKWQPAIKDGVAVRYTLRLPLTMTFQ